MDRDFSQSLPTTTTTMEKQKKKCFKCRHQVKNHNNNKSKNYRFSFQSGQFQKKCILSPLDYRKLFDTGRQNKLIENKIENFFSTKNDCQ